MGSRLGLRPLALDLRLHVAASHAPRVSRRAGSPRTAQKRGPRSARGHAAHGTDTGGPEGSTTDRDLALAATWQVDPAVLAPQPGDSAATLDARAKLAAVSGPLTS